MENEEASTEEVVQFQYEFSKQHVDKIRDVIGDLAVISHEIYLDILTKNKEFADESEVKDRALAVASAVIGAPWAFSLRVLAESTDKFEEVSGDAWELAQVIGDDVYGFTDFSGENLDDEDLSEEEDS